MAAVANVPVENEYPTKTFVPSDEPKRGTSPQLSPIEEVGRERRTTWSHASIIALELGGRGFSRDIEAFKSENGFSR
jgi:hypothetical protein